MKFVCDRCLTKYSIADEKVRGRILKIRCKSCSNIITVKESAPSAPISVASGDSDRTVISSGPHVTAKPAPPAAAAPPPRAPARARPPTPPGAHAAPTDDVQWFLALEGVQKGPFTRKLLVDRLLAMPKNSDVHVWNDTLDGWRPPTDVPAIAREMQARQRANAQPPPAPTQRLRPVPPPPSQSPASAERRISGGYATVGAAGHASHGAHAAAAHGHTPIVASHSSVGLGLASVAPVMVPAPTLPPSAGILDTPVPIKELVQAHKAHNGSEAHGAGLAAAAPNMIANGESDALNALNLGGSWRQPSAPIGPLEGRLSTASIAAATGARAGSRTAKLAVGAVLLVGICVALIFVAFKKPSPPPVAASPKVEPPPVVALNAPPPPPVPSEPSKEVKALRAPDPSDVSAEAEAAPTVARVGAKKSARPAALRNPSMHGGGTTATSTSPGAFTAEQRGDASRFGDASGRALQIRNPLAPAAKVTPNQGDITRVVNNNKGGIKVCYQRALLRDTSLTHGKIDVNVTIGISGRVKSVGVDGPAPFHALDPCIKDLLSRWVFPASSEEYGTAFSYVFQGNE